MIGIAVALDGVALWLTTDSRASAWMAWGVLPGVPIAIVVLIVCGAITRRFRAVLIAVGCLLLASPLIGIGLVRLVGSG